jgi:hypothetical protein
MADPVHGTRRGYQILRCPCDACKTANRRYSAGYRSAIRIGRPPLGAHVAGPEASRLVDALVTEGWSKAAIAHALGYPSRKLQIRSGVTVRTLLRLRRLTRHWTT